MSNEEDTKTDAAPAALRKRLAAEYVEAYRRKPESEREIESAVRAAEEALSALEWDETL